MPSVASGESTAVSAQAYPKNEKLAHWALRVRSLVIQAALGGVIGMAWLFVLMIVARCSHDILFGNDNESFTARAGYWALVIAHFMMTVLYCLTAVSDPSSKLARWTLMGNQTRAIAIMAVVMAGDLHLMHVLFRDT